MGRVRWGAAVLLLAVLVACWGERGASAAASRMRARSITERRLRADREQAADLSRLAARRQPHQRIPRSSRRGCKSMLSKLTLEEKVGQMTQPEITAITPAEVAAVPHRLRAQRRRLLARREQARHPRPTGSRSPTPTGPPRGTATSPACPLIWGIDAVHGNSTSSAPRCSRTTSGSAPRTTRAWSATSRPRPPSRCARPARTGPSRRRWPSSATTAGAAPTRASRRTRASRAPTATRRCAACRATTAHGIGSTA